MVISGLTKQPAEVFRQRIDYAYWLGGLMISAVAVSVEPADGTVPLAVTSTLNTEKTAVSLFFAGGDDGVTYTTTVQVTVTDGQVREDEVQLRVKEIA